MGIALLLLLVVVLWKRVNDTRKSIDQLNGRIDALEMRSTNSGAIAPVAQPAAKPRADYSSERRPSAMEPPPRRPDTSVVQELAQASVEQPPPAFSAIREADTIEPLQWLLSGNPVVRVGIVVLLCGVAFFFNYAIDRGWLPVEVRLTLAAMSGLALATIGWRLRASRRDYALVLQGGGIGIVYMTVFAAVNLYDVLGASAGLVLMVGLVVVASALAVLQDAQPMAVLASFAGFAAPLLVSHGNNHVALFSYYAALNVGIVAIALFRRWRLLNRVGFLCTFLASAAWGDRYYTPLYFATVEPFLVAYFILYVIVPVLFARRRGDGSSGVDGALVFGVPLLAFGLQAPLVRGFEYGLAYSALGASVLYLALAFALRRRATEFPRMLVQAFFALGVGFGTLAIPLAFDGRWTSAAWAVEGAGLVWLGLTQTRRLSYIAGVCLQFAAGFALFGAAPQQVEVPLFNAFCLGALMISGSAFFSALQLYRHQASLPDANGISNALLAWGLLWWFAAGSREISTYSAAVHKGHAFLVFAAVTSTILGVLRSLLKWRALSFPTLILFPVMVFTTLGDFMGRAHPLYGVGAMAWTFAIAAQYWLQHRLSSDWTHLASVRLHQGMLLLVVFLSSWELSWLAGHISNTATWRHVGWIAVTAAVISSGAFLSQRPSRLPAQFVEGYWAARVPLAGIASLWLLFTSASVGNPSPLGYVPMLNPLEMTQCLVLGVLLQWLCLPEIGVDSQTRVATIFLLGFIVLNGMIARVTHFFAGVDFHVLDLWLSPFYQATVSVVWTITAFALMVIARQWQERQAWYTGALLLLAVVGKLFAVDLDDVGTVERIVSFVCVGLLMLVMGYLSPLPPRLDERKS